MSTVTVSPLRQRMIEDMNARKLCAETQRGHIHSCRRAGAAVNRHGRAGTCLPPTYRRMVARDGRQISRGPCDT
jgi:hypothetical protein